MIRPNHEALSAAIHLDNVEAGWWTNLETGEKLNRNFGEMLALVHSELSEGIEGLTFNLLDTHLPHHRMVHVEIADACIRVYDMIGGLLSSVEARFTEMPLDFPKGFLSEIGKKN